MTPTLTIENVMETTRTLREEFHGNCHGVSLALVRSGLLAEEARVARGTAKGVGSQHSWVSMGDPYEVSTPIIDPTLWTYRDDVDDVWHGSRKDLIHMPHGGGLIWQAGRPNHQGGQTIELDREGLSSDAGYFLNLIEPLDLDGWRTLAHLPVEGWPAREILGRCMSQIKGFSAWVPVDVVAMLELDPEIAAEYR